MEVQGVPTTVTKPIVLGFRGIEGLAVGGGEAQVVDHQTPIFAKDCAVRSSQP